MEEIRHQLRLVAYLIPLYPRFYISQVVVWDFFPSTVWLAVAIFFRFHGSLPAKSTNVQMMMTTLDKLCCRVVISTQKALKAGSSKISQLRNSEFISMVFSPHQLPGEISLGEGTLSEA